ncbi:hypothetical protein QEZ54_20570 [Catellatospora sp. KI3]|uniref:hypothetical protein n=1 Tax=Catellatospora sp. KI3 TaxID=3041620 RepID=UPI0024832848|nr:hypothetical protein [Catellatospora sp. KI3]MDI1463379.1 hypothetical protein [Catellatospora sp. KI3]
MIDAAGAQSERAADDFAAVTSDRAWIMGQAKTVIKIDSRKGSPLAESLQQVVEAYFTKVPADGAGTMRDIQPAHDRVLILAGPQSPASINDTLGPLMDRLHGWAAQVPLAEALRNEPEEKAFRYVREHLTRAWRQIRSADPTDEELRALLRLTGVRSLDLDAGRDLADVCAALRAICEENLVDDVWRELQILAQQYDAERQMVDRPALLRRVQQKIALEPLARFRRSIALVKSLTEANLRNLGRGVVLSVPEGTVTLERALLNDLESVAGNLALIGDAGAGKTSILHRFAVQLRTAGHDVVVLRAEDLSSASRDNLNLDFPLHRVLAEWPGTAPGYLLVDGLDQVSGEDLSPWLSAVIDGLDGSRWRTITTIREFDLRNSIPWKTVFRGLAPDVTRSAPGLEDVRHMHVGNLTDDELAPIAATSPTLAALLNTADPRLNNLLRNPFNLSLAATLLSAPEPPDFTQISHRVQLLDQYWQSRVIGRGKAGLRTSVTKDLVHGMLAARSQTLDPMTLESVPDDDVVESLHREGLLRSIPAGPGHPMPLIEFSHPVLFDWAVALLALGPTTEPRSLITALNNDPDLVLTVRPSIEYRLVTIWHHTQTREAFWDAALTLGATHPLAAASAAKQAAELVRTPADTTALELACTATETHSAGWQPTHARTLLLLTTRYISLSARTEPMTELADMIARVAQRAKATANINLADLCLHACLRANLAAKINAATPGLTSWTTAICDSLTAGMTDPVASASTYIPRAGGQLLAAVTPHHPAAVEPILLRALQPQITNHWGPELLLPLADRFSDIAHAAPRLATAIAHSAWRHDGQPGVNGNRNINDSASQQILHSAQYVIADRFAALLSKAPADAIRTIAHILNASEPHSTDQHPAPPKLQYPGVMFIGAPDGTDLKLATMLAACLAGEPVATGHPGQVLTPERPLTETELADAVQILINELHNAEAWQKVLHTGAVASTPRLAFALAPALTSPNLFTHPVTWMIATYVALRIVADIEPATRRKIFTAVAGLVSDRGSASVQEDPSAHLRERASTIRRELQARLDGQPSGLPATPEDPSDTFRMIFFESSRPEVGSPAYLDQQIQEGHQLLTSSEPAKSQAGESQLLGIWEKLRENSDSSGVDGQRLTLALRLVKVPVVTPDSAIGREIYDVLTTAIVAQPTATPTANQDLDEGEGYYPSPKTRAVEGIVGLLDRPEWAATHGTQIRDLLRPLTADQDRGPRYISTGAMYLIHPDIAELVAAVEGRLRVETWRPIRASLLSQLWYTHPNDPQRIDDVIARLAGIPSWKFLTADQDDEVDLKGTERQLCLSMLASLACHRRTSFASARCAAWLASPCTYPRTASVIVRSFGNLLNPADPSYGTAQVEAFRLLSSLTATATSQLTTSTPEDAASVRSVLGEVAMQLYFASGATDKQVGREVARGSDDSFAHLALPILQKVGGVNDSRIAHYIMQTIDHLRMGHAAEAITIMGNVVGANPLYASEYQGMNDVKILITHLITEQSSAVLGHPRGLTTVRAVLEQLVEKGWDQAIDLYDSLTDLSMKWTPGHSW